MEASSRSPSRRPAGPPASTADFLARLDAGWLAAAYAAGGYEERRWPCSGRRPGRCPTSRCGSARCSAGWAAAWTGRAASPTPTPGTASWRERRSRGRRGAGPRAGRPAGQLRRRHASPGRGRYCSRSMSSARCRGGCRSGSCTSGPGRSGWRCRCRRSPGTGLAAADDDRYRIAATAEGGIWLLRTPHPEPVTALAGDRPGMDTSRRLLGVPAVEPTRAPPGCRRRRSPNPALVRAPRRRPGGLHLPRRRDVHPGQATARRARRTGPRCRTGPRTARQPGTGHRPGQPGGGRRRARPHRRTSPARRRRAPGPGIRPRTRLTTPATIDSRGVYSSQPSMVIGSRRAQAPEPTVSPGSLRMDSHAAL